MHHILGGPGGEKGSDVLKHLGKGEGGGALPKLSQVMLMVINIIICLLRQLPRRHLSQYVVL